MAIPQPLLVTGATGFIGRHLVARLTATGHRVRALALPQEDTAGMWAGQVEVARADIRDQAALAVALHDIQTVFHLAAVVGDWAPKQRFQEITIDGTRNILEAAAPQRAHVVLASSIVVYGDALRRDVCDEDHPFGKPQGLYGWAKQEQERLVQRFGADRGLLFTIVRAANVFGAGSQPWVHDVVSRMRRGLPVLVGRGPRNAGLVYVENLVDLFAAAAGQAIARNRVYNGSDDWEVTWEQYFRDLAAILGVGLVRPLPLLLAAPFAAANEFLWRTLRLPGRPRLTREALNLVAADSKIPMRRAREELAHQPRIPYAKALEAVAQYIRSRGL